MKNKKHLLPYHTLGKIEAGCDEAGRGCLAGPVVAAAVILPEGWSNPILNDSKQLSEKQRRSLREIIEKEAVSYAVSFVQEKEIDKINILNASITAMQRAVSKLNCRPDQLLIDGNRFHSYKDIPHHCIIKGDGKFLSIAAASVLAKTYRDEYMEGLHSKFPYYSWNTNKGYPTQAHRNAIIQKGTTKYHRQSFRLYPLPKQGELF